MPSYLETPPPITQPSPDSPKTLVESDNYTHSPTSRIGESNLAPVALVVNEPALHPPSPSATASLHLPIVLAIKSLSALLPAEFSDVAPLDDEVTMVGFANGLLLRRGRALALTSGSVLGESPPLPRRQDMEQLEQRVEDLQIAPRQEADGPRPSNLHHFTASARSAWSISQITSKRPCEEPKEGASTIVLAGHWSDESE
ncbi:hypothetical protein DER46DRAFT_664831 [Fusarium sp. MPI-SDFR-AT-0072]|nr:hypothetical protein DER46DRAFT_664831 [Fusarium sp. MPI-SDFR-AT-0072]